MWICKTCGEKLGKWRGGPDAVETFHVGQCDYCETGQVVCHSRRYGHPKKEEAND